MVRHALRESVPVFAGQAGRMVVCHGSGRIDEKLIPIYGSPFAIETATIKLADSDLCAEVTRSLFNTAQQYVETQCLLREGFLRMEPDRT